MTLEFYNMPMIVIYSVSRQDNTTRASIQSSLNRIATYLRYRELDLSSEKFQ